ncbi:MAG TPA: lipid A biosynthesis acyltransferase [Burkholderiales bacterium]|jgi:KDO2-lipid IV(A) lauroyltransferase|nr:lipid A biosynthesis acyltransferase [Burkholderiales bacterium]
MLIRAALLAVWLLHFLPLAVLAPLGRALGLLLYIAAGERRKVVLTNLKLCFPDQTDSERGRLARGHFQALGRSLVEHGLLWWSTKARLQGLVRIEGLEHWQSVAGRPVIWLAPHFVGLDMGGTRIITEWRGVSVYSHQKDPVFDRVLLHGRTRFVAPELYSRQAGIRPVVRAMRKGLPFYYLPDMDLGDRDSIFVPFFGVSAATITGLSRIAQLAGAVVVPAVTRQLPGGAGYLLRFYPAWPDFPGASVEQDTRRMNAFIEERVREMPEQYYWVHKRFKTRPPGEPSVYGDQ